MNWLLIKGKLYAIGAVLLAVIGFVLRLKFVTAQRDKFKEKAAGEAARADQAEAVAEAEAEIENEFSDLKRESERDIKDGKMPGNLRDRNNF